MLVLVSHAAVFAQAWPGVSFSGGVFQPLNGWTINKANEFNNVTHNFSNGVYYETNGFSFAARNDAGRHDEWFKSGNASVGGNVLRLQGNVEACPTNICGSTPKSYSGAEVYAGTSLNDANGNSHFGFYEARIKFPKGGGSSSWRLNEKNAGGRYKQSFPTVSMFQGVHPNFATCEPVIWLGRPIGYDANDNLPSYFGGFFNWTVNPTTGAGCASANYTNGYSAVSSIFDQWHNYGLLWTPTELRLYVDGNSYGNPIDLAGEGFVIQNKLRMAFALEVLQANVQNGMDLVNNPMLVDYIKYYTANVTPPKRWGVAWDNEHFREQSIYPLDPSIHYVTTENSFYVGGNFNGAAGDELVMFRRLIDNDWLITLSNVEGAQPWEDSKWVASDISSIVGTNAPFMYVKYMTGAISGDFVAGNGKEEMMVWCTYFDRSLYYLLENDPANTTSPSDWFVVEYYNGPMLVDASGKNFFTFNADGLGWDEMILFMENNKVRIVHYDQTPNLGIDIVQISEDVNTLKNGTTVLWTLASTDRQVVGNFNSDAKDEVLMIAADGRAKLLQYSSPNNWVELWTSGNPGSPGYIAVGGWNTAAADKYNVGDWDDDGLDEIMAVSPTGMYCKILNFTGVTWASTWGNGGSGTIADWWLKGTDKVAVGNFITDPQCNANDQLFMIRGEVLTVDHKWRANMYFSPLSQFWNNTVHNKSEEAEAVSGEVIVGETYTIYPNPSHGLFSVAGPEIERISVRDIQGRVLLETRASQLDLSTQPAGLYFIEVTGKGRRPEILKAINL